MTPNVDRIIALAGVAFATVVISGAAWVVETVHAVTAAQIDNGTINVLIAFLLATTVGAIGFVIKSLLDMRFWQGDIERRVRSLEHDAEEEEDHRGRR